MPETPVWLELENVTRRRGGRVVVSELSLAVHAGEVLGLLGVNGAGKSTTLAMMAGVMRPTRGRVRLAGKDLAEYPETVRTNLGWLPERTPLWPELTVGEHLAACAALHGLHGRATQNRCAELIERFSLTALRRRCARMLSQGERQRLGLACALVNDPPVLVLDEPATGLDPVQIDALHALLRERTAAGHAVVLSTHALPAVAAVCDRVAILHEGRLRHSGAVTPTLHETFMSIATSTQAEAA